MLSGQQEACGQDECRYGTRQARAERASVCMHLRHQSVCAFAETGSVYEFETTGGIVSCSSSSVQVWQWQRQDRFRNGGQPELEPQLSKALQKFRLDQRYGPSIRCKQLRIHIPKHRTANRSALRKVVTLRSWRHTRPRWMCIRLLSFFKSSVENSRRMNHRNPSKNRRRQWLEARTRI